MTPVVAIHPERALLLADALAFAARDLTDRSRRFAALLAQHGEPLQPAIEVGRAATVLAEEAVTIHRAISEVRAWEGAGGAGGRFTLLSGAVGASHRRPAEADRAARSAVAAYRRDGVGSLLGIEQPWLDDPVFATTLLSLLGPEEVVELLALVGATWGYPADSIERRQPLAVADVLAGLLATTSRAGAPGIGAPSLREAADECGSSPAVVGFLFLRDHEWDPSYLVSLVDEIVVPLNREISSGGVSRSAWFGPAGDGVDGRVLILAAVARREAAARAVAQGSDLIALVDGRADLLDGGASVGRLLVGATRPRVDADLLRLAPVVTRVVEAVVAGNAAGAVPGGIRAELGDLAAPWISGFGSTDFVAHGVPHPLPTLAPQIARDFLELGMADGRSSGDLENAAWGWARATLARMGPSTAPLLVKHVADVLRAVADASRAARVGVLAAEDRDARRLQEHADLAMSVLTLPLRSNPAGEATSVVVVAGTSHVVDAHLPATDRELRYLRDLPASISEEQWTVQYLVMAALWSRRDTNGLFAPAVGPPAPGQATRPTGRPFQDESGALRPHSTLDHAGRAAFARWLYELDDAGAHVAHLVNAAGAEYGGSG